MEAPTKRFGLDTEGGNREPGFPLRTIQIYSPTKGKTMLLHKAPGQTNWRLIWVDIKLALDTTEGQSCSHCIERTDKWLTDEHVKGFLTNPDHGFITQNGYYDDYVLLRDLGVQPNIVGDSFIYGILMPTGPQVSKSLDNLMKRYVEQENYDKNRWGGWEDHEWDFQELEDGAILYCSFDPFACYQIEDTLVKEYPRYYNHIYQMELDLLPVLSRMSHRGIKVDEEKFARSLFDYRQLVGSLQQKLNEKAGWVVRVGSNKDLGEYLFNQLGLTPQLMTKGGKDKTKPRKPSTSKDALAYLSHPDVQIVLDLKEAQAVLSGLESMWASDLGDRVEENGVKYRIYHPRFKPLSQSQGSRIYTEEPSVNQWTWAMRENIVPSQGGAFLYADISAFELILLAYASGQTDMLETYLTGRDLHRKEANLIFNIPEDQVDDKQREATKTTEYATIYGSEGASVARTLRIPLEQAEKLCSRFLEVNDKIRILRDRIHSNVMKSGIAKTPMGRLRKINEVHSYDGRTQAAGKRMAFNFFAQSGAADFAKQGLIWLDRNLPEGYYLVFPVFDSITFRTPDDDPKHKAVLDKFMAKALNIKVGDKEWQFLHKSGIGTNWKAAKDAADKSKVVIGSPDDL